MYVFVSGYNDLTLYIRSYAESSYDYTIAMNPDVDVATASIAYNSSYVKAHTRGN